MVWKSIKRIWGENENDPDDPEIQRRTVLRTAAGASTAGVAISSVNGSSTSENPEIADPVARYYTENSEHSPTEVHLANDEEKAILTEQFMRYGEDLIQLLSEKGIFKTAVVDMESFQTGAVFSKIGTKEADTESAYVGLREVDGRLRSELYYKIQKSADEGVIDQPTKFIISVIPATGDAYAHSTPEIQRGTKAEVPQRLIDPGRNVASLAEKEGTVLSENDVILFGLCFIRCERYTACPLNCAEIRICCQAENCSSQYTGYCCGGRECPSACCMGPRDPCPDGSCPQ
jgi:hypothetical protein